MDPPQKSDIMRAVATGIIPDGSSISYGGMRVDPTIVPDRFRELARRLGGRVNSPVAAAYEELADVVQAVVEGREISVKPLPRSDWINVLVDSFPGIPHSAVKTILNRTYVEAVATLMYGQY